MAACRYTVLYGYIGTQDPMKGHQVVKVISSSRIQSSSLYTLNEGGMRSTSIIRQYEPACIGTESEYCPILSNNECTITEPVTQTWPCLPYGHSMDETLVSLSLSLLPHPTPTKPLPRPKQANERRTVVQSRDPAHQTSIESSSVSSS